MGYIINGCIPPFVFGEGGIACLGETVKKYGDKVFLAIDRFFDNSDAGKRIEKYLTTAGVNFIKWNEIEPNPSCFTIDKAGAEAKKDKVQAIVAVGGGSVIDFGKAVSIIACNPGSSWDYTSRKDHEIRRPVVTLPVIAVPTTAGTGSETTPYAVLNNTQIREKSTIVSDLIFARDVIIDPELSSTMPPRLTASTGFDAFAHCLEALINMDANVFSRMASREGIKTIARYLPEAVANGKNREARANMAWGSAIGGLAISTVGATLPHAIGQPVGGFCGAPHGETIAACMVDILKMSWTSNPVVFAEISDILNPSGAGASVRERAQTCPELVQRLLDDCCLRVRFTDFGLTEKDIDKVTEVALIGYSSDINRHPRQVYKEDINAIYLKCL